jgi:class 3 adenylate cyclase
MEAFLNGAPRVSAAESKVLSLMVTDIVGSTRMAVERCDRRFRDLLDAHHETVRSELAQYRGEELNTTGDGFHASFDGPARAIRCAVSITDALHGVGIDCRIGLHAGECELRGGTASGVAIHIAARVAALASPSAILVSQTVRDLVARVGLRFSGAGTHALKGLPEE